MGRTTTNTTRPAFVADPGSIDRNTGRQVDWTNVPTSFKNTDGNKVIPAGTVMSGEVNSDAIGGAGKMVPRSATTTVTVAVSSNVATATATAHPFKVGDIVYVTGANLAYVNGEKTVATVPTANTFTFAAVGADASATGTITTAWRTCGILETNATENSPTDALSGYGVIVGGVVYENLLVDATGTPKVLPAQYKTELAELGPGFYWGTYQDSRS
jgi:hypothetical protein